jgi:preprotein translocase subunit SecE
VNANGGITTPPRTSELIRKGWSIASTVASATSIRRTRRPGNEFPSFRPVAPIGRAPVSKTGCWGFESLLACINFDWNAMEKITKFLKEVVAELRKVTWPSKDELIGSTIVTIVVSLIVAIFIGIVDRILTLVVHTIFGGGFGG